MGYDCGQAMLPIRIKTGKDDEPCAIETDLGWSIIGAKNSHLV